MNVAGTEIYDGETATGKYYHGTTVSSINIKYATDENWSNAIYNIMEDYMKNYNKKIEIKLNIKQITAVLVI